MKRLVGIMVISLFSSIAQAGLFISINGEVWQDPIIVDIEETMNLSIVSTDNEPASISALLVFEGPVTVDATEAYVIESLEISHPLIFDDVTGLNDEHVTQYGYDPVSILYLEITDVSIPPMSLPDGAMVMDISLQALAGGQDIVISLLDDKVTPPTIMDAQILRVPEPTTIMLFGLGVLGLWRRP